MGTVIAQTVVFIFLSYFYLSKNSYLKFSWRNLRPDMKVLKPMFTIGVSSLVQTAAGSISALIIIDRVEFYGGDIYLSAFGIIQRVMMFATMPAMVIGQASSRYWALTTAPNATGWLSKPLKSPPSGRLF